MNIKTKRDASVILTHYLIAALWSSLDENDNPFDDNFNIKDIGYKTKEQSKQDIKKFLEKAKELLGEATDEQIGHDFWLTRNSHGSGFWDNEKKYLNKKVGEKLTNIAKDFIEVFVYLADIEEEDDCGKIYFM